MVICDQTGAWNRFAHRGAQFTGSHGMDSGHQVGLTGSDGQVMFPFCSLTLEEGYARDRKGGESRHPSE